MQRKAFSALLVAFPCLILLLEGCYSVPVSRRVGLDLVSDSAIAEKSVEQFEQFKLEFPISRDPKKNAMVQQVGRRIAEVSEWDIGNPDWEFVVFQDDSQLNAFAMAGGKVGVFSGLFEVIEREDDLAIVMGHEVAHVAAKHIHERVSYQMINQGVALGISAAVAGQASISQSAILNAYGLGSAVSGLSFSRKMEKEADHIGLIYAARAGYDPRAALDLWERMSTQEQGGRPPEFLSTHPTHGTRMAYLRKIMPKALAEYETAKQGGSGGAIKVIE